MLLAVGASWKIGGAALLVVAYGKSAYQVFHSIIRPRPGENLRWFIPRAFICVLAFCVFMYWIVIHGWL
jgi:hypothetical protein